MVDDVEEPLCMHCVADEWCELYTPLRGMCLGEVNDREVRPLH